MQDFEPIERGESVPITARFAPLAAPAAPEAKPAAVRPKRKSKPLPDAVAATLPAAPKPLPAEPAAPPASPAETPPAADDAQARAEPAAPETPASGAAAQPPIVFPESIDLEFDIARNSNEARLGRIVHHFERDGARYMIQSVTSAAGISALFAAGRYVQESRGTLTPQGLQPEQFMVRRGRAERTESAAFDWAGSRAMLSANGAVKEWALQTGAQDQLSYLHQLSFLIADPSLPAVSVTNGRRFYNAKLEILGREVVATGLGPVNAVWVRSQQEGESRIDFWLAPDFGNLPVKVRIRDRRGEEVEQVLTGMKVK